MPVGTRVEVFVDELLRAARTAPDEPALISDDAVVTYAELDERVTEAASTFALADRSIVTVSGDRSIEFLVGYLAAMRAGHVPLLATPAHADALARTWSAAAITRAGSRSPVVERFDVARARLHPDLAMLLSTSGSTGAPKLVRLSHGNLLSNATAIVEYLRLTAADRAITTLPLHYCYGLSVLHSHLLAGASVVVTEGSVVDPCVLSAIDRHEVTNIAGVPHTFELLERSAFDLSAHRTIRFITQAGGRMAPARVRQWATRAERAGVDLYVMYGQTEATARMAYLPPAAAATHPQCIGRAIPGGSFELRPHPAASRPDEGELLYRGPNVMMGYATGPDDLARPSELAELHTGDLARLHEDTGFYELVGRASRFVKPFGVRVDLERVHELLALGGREAVVAGDDERLVVAAVGADPALLRHEVATLAGLPESAVRAHCLDSLPRTPSGKPDHQAVLDLPAAPAADEGAARPATVASVYRTVLGRDRVEPNDTFVTLGGDSLSYVECSLQLEAVLTALPADWHVRTVAELSAVAPTDRMSRIDTTIVLRAACILAILATHMRLHRVPGGAHTLLAVAGYNFARFQLSLPGAGSRLKSGLRAAARVGVPASLWIAGNMIVAGGYSIGAVALVNDYTGSSWRTDGRWQYWFFESFVQLVVVSTAIMAVPIVARAERRAPFAFALVLLAPLLVLRFEWLQFGDPYNYLYRTHTVAWCFVLGWLAFRSRTVVTRAIVTGLVLLAVPGFFDQWYREGFVLVAFLTLLWLPTLPMPRLLQRPIGIIAAASMWTFLVHWQLYPPLDRMLEREIAYVLTLAAGIAVWWSITRLPRLLRTTPQLKGNQP